MPNRRDFLKGLFAAAALTQVPIPAADPPLIYGELRSIEGVRFVEMGRAIPAAAEPLVVQLLQDDARRYLAPGTIFEIRQSMPLDFGRAHMTGWYAHRQRQKAIAVTKGFDPMLGVYMHGQFKA